MALVTIVRRLLGEVRWSLGFSAAAFLGLALLWNWPISLYQFPPPPDEDEAGTRAEDTPGEDTPGDERIEVAEGEDDPEDERRRGRRRARSRGPGIFVGFGVPPERFLDPDDPPTLAMQAAMANHPLILLTLMGWAIARGSAAVAGEVERGTLDLTLSRPVRRSTYLAAQVVAAAIVLAVLCGSLVAGHLAAPLLFRLENVPGPADHLPSVLMVAGLGLAIFGVTLAFSARDLSRARAGILGLGVVLAGLVGMILARQLEGYDWLADLSVFRYYAPVGLTLDPAGDARLDLAVLLGIFGAGLALAFTLFLRRDLPTNG